VKESLPPELAKHFQKTLGYSLSASTNEKAIFICWGEADAGKTTLLSTVRELLGDYSTVVRPQTLMGVGRDSNSQSDLATLRGKRFAQVSETKHDEQLAQHIIKSLCQGSGGRLKVVPKHINAIEFDETCKIWLECNSLPRLLDPYDPGMRVRLHPFHFASQTPPERIDRTLHEKIAR
jgi:phage/plasmid-associated DNA primase